MHSFETEIDAQACNVSCIIFETSILKIIHSILPSKPSICPSTQNNPYSPEGKYLEK